MNVIARRLKERYAGKTEELEQLGDLLKNNELNDVGYRWFNTVREFGEYEMDDGGWDEVEAEGLGDQTPEEMMKYYFENVIDFDDDHKSWDWDNDHVVRFPSGQAKVVRDDNFSDIVETVAKNISKNKLEELGLESLK